MRKEDICRQCIAKENNFIWDEESGKYVDVCEYCLNNRGAKHKIGKRGMNRKTLDNTIKYVEQILNALKTYSEIIDGGNCCCITCHNKSCEWKPKRNQPIRYNCPHYQEWRPEV